ncbi:hypothetical protein RQP46_009191 [Phenoliferia psychrophenolica]
MFGARAYNGHRGEIHQILWNHAISLGVDIRCSSNVTSFWDTEASCGVICNGERLEADVVVGADGVRSKARELVLGYEDKPVASGYAIYRAWFDAKESGIADDPLTSYLVEGGKDHFYGWIGQDVHFLASSLKGGKDISYVITHKDDADIEESWQLPPGIRYGRVRRAQLGGVAQREAWHKTDSEDAKANPDKMMIPREEWLLGHDAEAHAFAAYPAVAKQILAHGYKLPVLPEST